MFTWCDHLFNGLVWQTDDWPETDWWLMTNGNFCCTDRFRYCSSICSTKKKLCPNLQINLIRMIDWIELFSVIIFFFRMILWQYWSLCQTALLLLWYVYYTSRFFSNLPTLEPPISLVNSVDNCDIHGYSGYLSPEYFQWKAVFYFHKPWFTSWTNEAIFWNTKT